ncbi:MAG: CinA family protein [Christensenellaceae bacterium]|jgi:nicotinamide-nucleotide amidase|nr:CinA family protein [Christensenellaceae bacterium]
MEFVIQVCASESEIKRRLEESAYDIPYELIGADWDYTIVFDEVDEQIVDLLFDELDDIIYGVGELSLAETFVRDATEREIKVAVAESCTGGMLAAAITDVPGASAVLYEGIIAYSNDAKIDRLGVKVSTLGVKGAVSEDTAAEMAEGLLSANVDLGISTTGIAGPTGDKTGKPVGLVCIAVSGGGTTDVYRNIYKGDRFTIRNKAKNCALFYALKHVNKYN